jgi:hypothetical protein
LPHPPGKARHLVGGGPSRRVGAALGRLDAVEELPDSLLGPGFGAQLALNQIPEL